MKMLKPLVVKFPATDILPLNTSSCYISFAKLPTQQILFSKLTNGFLWKCFTEVQPHESD